jgi:hypothetical protein
MNFFVENIFSGVTAFKIAYGDSADALSNEVTTWPLEKIVQKNGSYNWYIDKLPPKAYVFKIFGVSTGGVLVPDFSSEIINATVGQ